ncbi:thioredoxin family protein [Sodalis sp. RH22]|uniref:thioredoxin family protein n=1 Tax=unclassified Sodalis (in: enterobacteria) TaxID=2636512 RepID=UPI0039B4EAF5
MSLKPNELTDSNFDNYLAGARLPVLVDLWAPWCVPCRAMAPVIDKLANNTEGKLLVAKIDVEKYPAIMERYGVRGIPTLLLFRGEAEPVRQVGAQSLGQLNAWLAAHEVDVVSQPPVRQTEALEWSSFYGDEGLHGFIAQRTLGHAKAGDITVAPGSFWLDGKGTTMAAMIHQPDSVAFERITGLPIALGRLLDRCGYLTPEQIGGLFAALRPGKDYRLVPQRFMHWWLSEESAPWADYLRDPRLGQLLMRWLTLSAGRLAGGETAPGDWSAIKEQADLLLHDYQQPERQLEKIIATLLQHLSPLPAAADDEKWGNVALGVSWAQFQQLQILAGWSDDDRATPDIRFAWFTEKERLSPAGKLSQEEITLLRAEWLAQNPAFIAKENTFHQNYNQLSEPINTKIQRALNRLLAEAPDF